MIYDSYTVCKDCIRFITDTNDVKLMEKKWLVVYDKGRRRVVYCKGEPHVVVNIPFTFLSLNPSLNHKGDSEKKVKISCHLIITDKLGIKKLTA